MGAGMGVPGIMADLLRWKYSIMQQQADTGQFNATTNRLGVSADANLNNVRAGLLPDESRASTNLQYAQAGLADATTDQQREETKFVAPLARANIRNSDAQSRLYGSQATAEDQLSKLIPTRFRFRGLPRANDFGPGVSSTLRTLGFGLGPYEDEE